jgi:hypothetical protein
MKQLKDAELIMVSAIERYLEDRVEPRNVKYRF